MSGMERFATSIHAKHRHILPKCVPQTSQSFLHCRLGSDVYDFTSLAMVSWNYKLYLRFGWYFYIQILIYYSLSISFLLCWRHVKMSKDKNIYFMDRVQESIILSNCFLQLVEEDCNILSDNPNSTGFQISAGSKVFSLCKKNDSRTAAFVIFTSDSYTVEELSKFSISNVGSLLNISMTSQSANIRLGI